MQITDVRVRKIEKEGKMKAIVSITLDNEFVIHDIKVIEGEKGLFIAMPSRKAADGEYRDIAHPINSETREKIQDMILNKYETTALEAAAEQAGTFGKVRSEDAAALSGAAASSCFIGNLFKILSEEQTFTRDFLPVTIKPVAVWRQFSFPVSIPPGERKLALLVRGTG